MKTQLRGNCQCCGRDQAVLATGLMSKHGYTVDHGWFSGVCHGQNHKPLQQDRTATAAMVNQIHADVVKLRADVEALEAGTLKPLTARPNKWDYRHGVKDVPFDSAPPECQRDAVQAQVRHLNGRIQSGLQFARFMADLADKVFGQPLRTVEVEAAPADILAGERRQNSYDNILTCRYTQGQRVYWRCEANGRQGWTGKASWRAMKEVSK